MFPHLSSVINQEKHSFIDKEQHFCGLTKKVLRYISFNLISFIKEVPGQILKVVEYTIKIAAN